MHTCDMLHAYVRQVTQTVNVDGIIYVLSIVQIYMHFYVLI